MKLVGKSKKYLREVNQLEKNSTKAKTNQNKRVKILRKKNEIFGRKKNMKELIRGVGWVHNWT